MPSVPPPPEEPTEAEKVSNSKIVKAATHQLLSNGTFIYEADKGFKVEFASGGEFHFKGPISSKVSIPEIFNATPYISDLEYGYNSDFPESAKKFCNQSASVSLEWECKDVNMDAVNLLSGYSVEQYEVTDEDLIPVYNYNGGLKFLKPYGKLDETTDIYDTVYIVLLVGDKTDNSGKKKASHLLLHRTPCSDLPGKDSPVEFGPSASRVRRSGESLAKTARNCVRADLGIPELPAGLNSAVRLKVQLPGRALQLITVYPVWVESVDDCPAFAMYPEKWAFRTPKHLDYDAGYLAATSPPAHLPTPVTQVSLTFMHVWQLCGKELIQLDSPPAF